MTESLKKSMVFFFFFFVPFTFLDCSVSVTKIRRTESVPSDINNPVDRPAEAPQFGTLPKAITKKVLTFMVQH